MKILSGFFYMELPDDFDGSIKDALILMGDHTSESPVLVKHSNDDPEYKAATEELWNQFLSGQKVGGKFTGYLNIQKYNSEKEEWDKIEEA